MVIEEESSLEMCWSRFIFITLKKKLCSLPKILQHSPLLTLELNYADQFKMTLLNRKKLVSITKALGNTIGYQWGFPTKLSIKRQGRLDTIMSRKAGLALLKKNGASYLQTTIPLHLTRLITWNRNGPEYCLDLCITALIFLPPFTTICN